MRYEVPPCGPGPANRLLVASQRGGAAPLAVQRAVRHPAQAGSVRNTPGGPFFSSHRVRARGAPDVGVVVAAELVREASCGIPGFLVSSTRQFP